MRPRQHEGEEFRDFIVWQIAIDGELRKEQISSRHHHQLHIISISIDWLRDNKIQIVQLGWQGNLIYSKYIINI